jgi:hypothetical protein
MRGLRRPRRLPLPHLQPTIPQAPRGVPADQPRRCGTVSGRGTGGGERTVRGDGAADTERRERVQVRARAAVCGAGAGGACRGVLDVGAV